MARGLLNKGQSHHEQEALNMENATQGLNLHDLATAFIAFGMVVGLLLR